MNIHSDLEIDVMSDMIRNDLDPYNKQDIQTYWKERLDEPDYTLYERSVWLLRPGQAVADGNRTNL